MALHRDYRALADELKDLLTLTVPPLAITFSRQPPPGVARYASTFPPATPDGRTGAVPAGCVFWMKAAERTFFTVAEDHGNCSVGSVTHGFKALDEVMDKADVGALCAAGWVTPEACMAVPVVKDKPGCVTYGPLAETPTDPDVVFLRLNGKQLMMLNDSWPGLRFEGKPQCHIVAIARELGEAAVSTGCMLSRVRTGMSVTEVTCAVPAARLPELVSRLKAGCGADQAVAAYAAEDSRRFA